MENVPTLTTCTNSINLAVTGHRVPFVPVRLGDETIL